MGSFMPDNSLSAVDKQVNSWCRQPRKEATILVLDRPLSETGFSMVRRFLEQTTREDLRLRFGSRHDFCEHSNLRRFFDVTKGDVAWMLDKSCAITAILHRVPVSPAEAEIAIVVRSDLKRTGIGESLLRDAIERSKRSPLKTLSGVIAWESKAALRLASKLGFVARTPPGPSIEMELRLEEIDNKTLTH